MGNADANIIFLHSLKNRSVRRLRANKFRTSWSGDDDDTKIFEYEIKGTRRHMFRRDGKAFVSGVPYTRSNARELYAKHFDEQHDCLLLRR